MQIRDVPSIEDQLATMRQKSDDEIDFSDIPEILDWSNAVRGKSFRPVSAPSEVNR